MLVTFEESLGDVSGPLNLAVVDVSVNYGTVVFAVVSLALVLQL